MWSLETEISQIESSCFTPKAWKSMGILQFCDVFYEFFKESLLTVFAGMRPFLWISKWDLAQFEPTQLWFGAPRTFHDFSGFPQFWMLGLAKVYTFFWGETVSPVSTNLIHTIVVVTLASMLRWIWPNLECNLKTRDSQIWPNKR